MPNAASNRRRTATVTYLKLELTDGNGEVQTYLGGASLANPAAASPTMLEPTASSVTWLDVAAQCVQTNGFDTDEQNLLLWPLHGSGAPH
jgi:hypothetical protein